MNKVNKTNSFFNILKKESRSKIFFFPLLLGMFCLLFLSSGCKPSANDGSAEGSGNDLFSQKIEQGNKAMENKDYTGAINAFSEILTPDLSADKKEDLLFRRATAYFARGKEFYDRATLAWKINQDQKTAEEETAQADTFLEKSSADLKELLSQNDKNADAYYLLGNIHLLQANWGAAKETLSKTISLNPDDPCAWQRRGEVNMHIGDTYNGQADLQKAAELGYVDNSETVPVQEKNAAPNTDTNAVSPE